MPGLTRFSLHRLIPFLLAVTLVACNGETYSGAPEGYNFKTLEVTWTYDGNITGTRQIFLETKTFENGALVYKRMAGVRDMVRKIPGDPGRTSDDQGSYFNVEGVQTSMAPSLKSAIVARVEMAPLIIAQRFEFWLPTMRFLIRRDDLSKEKKTELQKRLVTITDEELTEIGATITEEDLMGHKTKHYVIPIADGTSEIWTYGDIGVKNILVSNWRGTEVKDTIEPTVFKVNEKLPEQPFTIPKDFKVIDRTKETAKP
ncbi:MAG: hypothetical protein Q8R92_19380 [Deltaproteobacteria bacterium]|nr:hypothetical protein [Deltaproteobacteria bacterium]